MDDDLSGAAAALAGTPEGARTLARLWPLLEQMRQEGAVVVVKLDGQRRGDEATPYTVVVSNGRLGEGFVTSEETTIERALAQAVLGYTGKSAPS